MERDGREIRISFREAETGGGVRRNPQGGPSLFAARRLLLLVHGFNVDAREAADTYDGFAEMQRTLIGETDGDYAEGRLVVRVLWPGDAGWGIASPLFYPWSIGRAKETAEALAENLRLAYRSGLLLEIDVIAHSLGCRVALETIRCLHEGKDGPAVRRVVLMAGAVPTFMLGDVPDARLRRAYDATLRDPSPALSLFSGRDGVLSWAFPLGQTAAGGGEGFLPTALGHEEWESGDAPANLLQREIENAGHSDYWGHRREINWSSPWKAGRLARSFLGLEPLMRREVEDWSRPGRETAESRTGVPERERPARRTGVYDAGDP